MNWIKTLSRPSAFGLSLGLLLLIIFASLNDWGVTGVIFIVLAYFLGLATGNGTSATPPLDSYLDSDWRHFEWLIELTPEQLAKLQSLSRRPDQKDAALTWLESQWQLKQGYSEQILHFFVRSGWASGGNHDHSTDPDWNWSAPISKT